GADGLGSAWQLLGLVDECPDDRSGLGHLVLLRLGHSRSGVFDGRIRLDRSSVLRPRLALLAHDDEDLAHLDDLAFGRTVMEHDPSERRRDLDHRLVRFHLDDGLVHPDRAPDRHHPPNDLGFGEAFADIGKSELLGHQVSSVWRAALTIRSTLGRYWCSDRLSGKTLSHPVTRRTGASSE